MLMTKSYVVSCITILKLIRYQYHFFIARFIGPASGTTV